VALDITSVLGLRELEVVGAQRERERERESGEEKQKGSG